MTDIDLKAINLASPNDAEMSALRRMNEADRRDIVAAWLAKGDADHAAGRTTTIETDADIKALFDEIWPVS